MNHPEFDHRRLGELLLISADPSLPEAERKELNSLLRSNAAARAFAARTLTLDTLLTEHLASSEAARLHASLPSPIQADFKRTRWLARAAAWIGACHLFSNTAKAATAVILMKKAITSITAAILVLGGGGIYVIHRINQSSRARVATMETEIQSLSDQLGIKTSRSPNRRAGAIDAQKNVGIAQVSAIYAGDHQISMREGALLEQFGKQLAAMDAESLEILLLDAEKISRPIHGRVAERIMAELISKDPARATRIASQLVGRGSGFQFLLSAAAAKAFKAWLAEDPAAAHAWHVATAASGGLNGKSIAPSGLEKFAIDRSFARLRFAAQVAANPTEAAAMLATMLPADVTAALQEVTDPDALRQILPALAAEQKIPAAEGAIKAMAANDPNAAFTWARSLGMGDRERDTLMASGIAAAVASGKLDLTGVTAWSKILNLDPARRSDLQVTAALESSFVPGDDRRVADWNRVADSTAWLRKEAPPEAAGQMVGAYLGQLAYNSRNPDQSFKAYEQEVAQQGSPDPALTIAYTSWLGRIDSDYLSGRALTYLRKLPASKDRDDAIRHIELNR